MPSALAIGIFCIQPTFADEAVELSKAGKKNLGWSFDNGQEFPGAKGTLTVDTLQSHKGRQDIFVPLPEVGEVKLTRIDGSTDQFHASDAGLTLGISAEPLLLEYKSSSKELPSELKPPLIKLKDVPSPVAKGDAASVTFSMAGTQIAHLQIIPPPFWKIETTTTETTLTCKLTCPPSTWSREGRLLVRIKQQEQPPSGEISIPVQVISR